MILRVNNRRLSITGIRPIARPAHQPDTRYNDKYLYGFRCRYYNRRVHTTARNNIIITTENREKRTVAAIRLSRCIPVRKFRSVPIRAQATYAY